MTSISDGLIIISLRGIHTSDFSVRFRSAMRFYLPSEYVNLKWVALKTLISTILMKESAFLYRFVAHVNKP
jgi:hypothetical protein